MTLVPTKIVFWLPYADPFTVDLPKDPTGYLISSTLENNPHFRGCLQGSKYAIGRLEQEGVQIAFITAGNMVVQLGRFTQATVEEIHDHYASILELIHATEQFEDAPSLENDLRAASWLDRVGWDESTRVGSTPATSRFVEQVGDRQFIVRERYKKGGAPIPQEENAPRDTGISAKQFLEGFSATGATPPPAVSIHDETVPEGPDSRHSLQAEEAMKRADTEQASYTWRNAYAIHPADEMPSIYSAHSAVGSNPEEALVAWLEAQEDPDDLSNYDVYTDPQWMQLIALNLPDNEEGEKALEAFHKENHVPQFSVTTKRTFSVREMPR
jgi:hypothetical protein